MSDRVRRVQGLRSSGAAGPHKGRDPRIRLTDEEAIEEGLADSPVDAPCPPVADAPEGVGRDSGGSNAARGCEEQGSDC